MSQGPEVTAIVVSYNHAAYVASALDSIAGQSYSLARIICVDDCSTDDTREAITQWVQSSGLNVDVTLRAENLGLCANLNAALSQVTTPLYTYISADDRMLPERLERQVARWVEDGEAAAAVYSDAYRIDPQGERLLPRYGALNDWIHVPSKEGHVFEHLLRHNWIPAASVLLNTSAVVAAGGYDEQLFYEDHDLWLRLARTGTLLCVPDPLVEIRELDTSLGATHFHPTDHRYVAARLRIMLKNYGVSESGDDYLRDVMPVLAVRLWELGVEPELVAEALAVNAKGRSTPGIVARRILLRAGITREPRAFRIARTKSRRP